VLVAIVWFLHRVFGGTAFGGSGLGIVATLLSVMVVAGAVIVPVREFAQRVRSRWKSQTLSPRRLMRGLAAFGLVLGGLLLIPLPYSVRAPFVVYPAEAQPVFVSVAGRIESAVPSGSQVQKGELLGELANHDLLLQHERQNAEVARLTLRLKHIEAQRGSNEALSMRLPATRDALASARRRLEQLTTEVQRLRLISPTHGTVLPPPNVSRSRPSDDGLSEWHGTPLEPANHGATLREQTLFCYVGDPARQDALLLVDQDAVEFVRVGQTVRLQFLSAPGRVRAGRVEEIAAARAESLPRELAVTRLIAVRGNGSGVVPAEVAYEVRVRLTDAMPATLYSPGRARIDCGTQSLGSRLWRLLRHTFSAEWSVKRIFDF